MLHPDYWHCVQDSLPITWAALQSYDGVPHTSKGLSKNRGWRGRHLNRIQRRRCPLPESLGAATRPACGPLPCWRAGAARGAAGLEGGGGRGSGSTCHDGNLVTMQIMLSLDCHDLDRCCEIRTAAGLQGACRAPYWTRVALAFAPNPGKQVKTLEALEPRRSATETQRRGTVINDGEEQAIGGTCVARRTPVPFKGRYTPNLSYTTHAMVCKGSHNRHSQ